MEIDPKEVKSGGLAGKRVAMKSGSPAGPSSTGTQPKMALRGALSKHFEKNATVSASDLRNLAKSRRVPSNDHDKAVSDAGFIGLTERGCGTADHYTSDNVLREEGKILDDAEHLSEGRHHFLPTSHIANIFGRHARLNEEQRDAVRHVTQGQDLAVVTGEAGTGKTSVLAVIREAYGDRGYETIGLSWTNDIAQDLKRGAGFSQTNTVMSELNALRRDPAKWDDKTLVVLDETTMVPTTKLCQILDKARASGAKIVLVGDARQLPSIDRGGMFEVLANWYGSAELHQVLRVADKDQQLAFNHMHERRFADALEIFSEQGAIRFKPSPDEARAELVETWKRDCRADPDRSRLALAYTNADVALLNRDLRAAYKEMGHLRKTDVMLDVYLDKQVKKLAFAEGDRVQFRENNHKERIYNGRTGTIQDINSNKVLVQDDSGIGIEFDPKSFKAFDHAYAGTINRGQGKTFDQTYLLHSIHWKTAESYVALTRHRIAPALFISETVAKDIDTAARLMGRGNETRAASQFHRHQDDGLVGKMAALSIGGKRKRDVLNTDAMEPEFKRSRLENLDPRKRSGRGD